MGVPGADEKVGRQLTATEHLFSRTSCNARPSPKDHGATLRWVGLALFRR